MIKYSKKKFILCTLFIVPVFISCKLPVDPQKRDLVELERIWQHLSAYSIYTDRVPDEKAALSFDDPFTLVDSIQDTMHSPWETTNRTFGIYYYDWKILYDEIYGIRRGYPSVYFRKLSDNTAYFRIKSFEKFTYYDTYYEMLDYTDSVKTLSNIILDLRYNGGGFVDVCKDIVELFLPVNMPYLYEERRESIGNGKFSTIQKIDTTLAPDTSDWGGKKIAILINKNSASAAEILAIALRCGMENNNLNIFGEKSFGKGIGQYAFLFNTTSGAGLKLTGLRFKGVSGNDDIDIYHEKGIIPDIFLPDSTKPLFREELMGAGKWLEPDFENTVNTAVLDIVKEDNFKREGTPGSIGCYKIAKMPDF